MNNILRLRYTITDRPGDHNHEASWRNRCTYCGHRVPPDHRFIGGGWGKRCIFYAGGECGLSESDHVIRQTREQPWRIPSEIVHRFLAMRHRKPTSLDAQLSEIDYRAAKAIQDWSVS